MEVTSTRIRVIHNSKYKIIASVTLDDELIINDIRVLQDGQGIKLIFPNSNRAAERGQYNLLPQSELYVKIKNAVIKKLSEKRSK